MILLDVVLEKLKQPGKLFFKVSQAVRFEFPTLLCDELADLRRDGKLGMLLRRKGGVAICGLEVLVPVFVLRLEDGDTTVSIVPQNLGKPPIGLDARRVVVEAEENVADIGVLLQHPEHGVLTGAARTASPFGTA